jgi:hypothetical protein
MKKLIINIAAFQIGWFSCVLGAANGYPLLGPVVVGIVVIIHLLMVKKPRGELQLLLLAAITGAVFDSLLVMTGWLAYPNGTLFTGTAPYWIVAMWVLFATTLNVSLRWLQGRVPASIVLGAVGGPLSYLAGARLGGLVFIDQGPALIALGIGWAAATPILVSIAARLEKPELVEVGSNHA